MSSIRKQLEQLAGDSPTRYDFRHNVERFSNDALPLSLEKMLEFYKILEDEAYSIAKTYSGDSPVKETILVASRKVVKQNNIEYLQKINSQLPAIEQEQLFELLEDMDNLTRVFSTSPDVKDLIENYGDMSTDEKAVCLQKILDLAAETLDLPETLLKTFEEARDNSGILRGQVSPADLRSIHFNIHNDNLKNPIRNIDTIIHELMHIKQWHRGGTTGNALDEMVYLSKQWVLTSKDFGHTAYSNSLHEWEAGLAGHHVADNLKAMTAPCTYDTASTCFNEGLFDQFADCIGEICNTAAFEVLGQTSPLSAVGLLGMTIGKCIVQDKIRELNIESAVRSCRQQKPIMHRNP